MAEPSSLSTSRRRAPASAAITSVVKSPSSTQTVSGDARGRPQHSRHVVTAGLTAPLVGPADIATSPRTRLRPRSCGAIADLVAPLVGPAGIVTAALSPSFLRSRPGRSGLRDHYQRRRGRSSIRTASRDARGTFVTCKLCELANCANYSNHTNCVNYGNHAKYAPRSGG